MAIWINTGTISISAGGTTVTGSGTSFLTGGAQKGDMFQAPDGREYEITNIVSDTQLSIFKAYQGTNVTDSSNWDIIPTQGYVKALVDEVRTYIESSAEIINQIEATGLSIENGGTGAMTASGARTNLGLGNVDNTADSAKNVLSATKLTTGRTINGVTFDGTGNVTTTLWGVARTLSFTGDVTGSASVDGSANVATAMTLANSGVTAGTYNSVTVDAKGRVTAGTNPTTLSGYGITDAYMKNETNTIIADITLTAVATAIDFTGLDINTDGGMYEIEILTVVNTSTTAIINLYVNGDTASTNYYSQLMSANDATVFATRLNSPLAGTIEASASNCSANIRLMRSSNGGISFDSFITRGNVSTIFFSAVACKYINTLSNITSIRLASTVANAFGIGTRIRVSRRKI